MLPILDGLNEAQRLAVLTTEGPLLVIAGPGTGKTLTMVRRIARLVEQGCAPVGILAVTFTSRAAREMRERTAALLGRQAAGIFIGTFHLLGLSILRENLGHEFTLCDRERQIEILKPLVGDSSRKARQMAESISRIKNGMDGAIAGVAETYKAYEEALANLKAYDFDDLIRTPAGLLEDPGIAGIYRNRFAYIVVDEYQDMSATQYRLLRPLVGAKENICAVGDSDQAIYAFRGANLENFLNFQKDFPAAQVITLTENYRSTGTIVEASSKVIEKNRQRIEKKVEAVRHCGKSITAVSVPDEAAEGQAIVKEIEARIGGTSHYRLMRDGEVSDLCDGSYGFSDFAVLYRTNAQARSLEEAFGESGIPFQVVGKGPQGRKREIIEHLLAQPAGPGGSNNLSDLLREAWQATDAPESDLHLLEALGRVYGLYPLPEAVAMICDELKLFAAPDTFDPRADAVTLMTLHMAKGLEFRVVFITGLEEGLLPHVQAENDDGVEEERRLFYVGMTRAKDELVLFGTRSRTAFGKREPRVLSPFLTEIPEMFKETAIIEGKGERRKRPRQMQLF